MARPDRELFAARIEFRARPSHKALWEELLDHATDEKFSEWLNDAANERARRILESREPGSWPARGIPIRRPSPSPAVSAATMNTARPTQPATKPAGKKPRRKR